MKKLILSILFLISVSLSATVEAYVWMEYYPAPNNQIQIKIINTGPVHVNCRVITSYNEVIDFYLMVGYNHNIFIPNYKTFNWQCW